MPQSLFVTPDSVQSWSRGGLQRSVDIDVLDVDAIRKVLGRSFDLSTCPSKPVIMRAACSAFCRDPIPSSVLARYDQISDPPIHLRAIVELLTRASAVCVWPQPSASFNCTKFQQTSKEMDDLISPQNSSNIHRATDAILSGQPAFLPIRHPTNYRGTLEIMGNLAGQNLASRSCQTVGGSQRPCLHLVFNIANITFGDANKPRYEPLWGSMAIYLRRTTDSRLTLLKVSESVSFDFATKDVLGLIGHDAQSRDMTTTSEASRLVEFRLPMGLDYNLADLVLVMQIEQLLHSEHNNRHQAYLKADLESKQTQKNFTKNATSSIISTSTASVITNNGEGRTLFDESSPKNLRNTSELQRKDQHAIYSRASNVWKRIGAVRTLVAFGFAPLDLSSLLLSPQPILDILPENFNNKLLQHILKSHTPIISGDKIIITPLHRYNHSSSWSFVHLNQGYEDFLTHADGFHELLEEHYSAWLSKSIQEVRYIQASVMLQILNVGFYHRSKNVVSISFEGALLNSLNPDMTPNQTVIRRRTLRRVFESSVSAISSDSEKGFRGTDGFQYPTELAALLSGATDCRSPLVADEFVRLLTTDNENNLARDMMDLSLSTANLATPSSNLSTVVYSAELDNFFSKCGLPSFVGADLFSNRMYLYINKCLLHQKRAGNVLVRVELRDSDDLSSYTVIQSFYSRYIENYNPTTVSPSSFFCSSVVQLTGHDIGRGSKAPPAAANTVDLPLLLPSQITCCSPHTKAAYFGNEFKLELPLVITERMHFFFTVFLVNISHGDKQDRLISLDDTVSNTSGSTSGINLKTSNFSASMSTMSATYKPARTPDSATKLNTTYRAIKNDAFTPIGYTYLPLHQFDSVHNRSFHLPSDYISLRIFETDVQSGYLSIPNRSERMDPHLIVKCKAQSSIFIQDPILYDIFEQCTLIYQTITRSSGSLTGTMASSGSYGYEIEASPVELSNMIHALSSKLQDLLERLQKNSNPDLKITVPCHLPVIVMIYSIIRDKVINIKNISDAPIVLASVARTFSLLVLIAKSIETESLSSHDLALDYVYRLLFSACVYRSKPQHDSIFRNQTQYEKLVSKFLSSGSELEANKNARLARIESFSKLQEPWRKTSNTSIYSLSFVLDSRTCFSNPIPSLYAKPIHESTPYLIESTIYRGHYGASLFELTMLVEMVLLHLDTDTSLGTALQATWYSLHNLERSMVALFKELRGMESRQDVLDTPQEKTVPASPSMQTPVLTPVDLLSESPTGTVETSFCYLDSDFDRFQSGLRRLVVILGQRIMSYLIKTHDKAEILPNILKLVARIIAVCHAFHYDTLGNILTVNFCNQVMPVTVDTSWSYHSFKQMQVATSVHNFSRGMSPTGFAWADIELETLAGVEAPQSIQQCLGCCYTNVYYPFFSEILSIGLPYIHFTYNQFRRYSKAGRIDGESIPPPPEGLVSIRKLTSAAHTFSGHASTSQSLDTNLHTKQVLPPPSTTSTPINKSVIRATPANGEGFASPQTPLSIETSHSIIHKQEPTQPQIQDHRQQLFNSIERLNTKQLMPPLFHYFQEIFVHCLLRCSSSVMQMIILFFKELLMEIPFYTTDAFLGCWDKYNHYSAYLIRPIFYVLTATFRKIASTTFVIDMPSPSLETEQATSPDQHIDFGFGESSDASVTGLQQNRQQSALPTTLDPTVTFSMPSVANNILPFHISSVNAVSQTISTITIRTVIHLILFSIVYDRDILNLSTTSLEHLATVCLCISMIPKYYAPSSLNASQFLSIGPLSFISRHIENLYQASTRYELDTIMRSTEFCNATDKMACLVGVYLRQLDLLYSPVYISTSPLVDVTPFTLKKRRRHMKAGLFRSLASKKRSASSNRNQFGDQGAIIGSTITTPIGPMEKTPLRGSIFEERTTPSQGRNVFSSSRKRTSIRTKRKSEMYDRVSVQDPIFDAIDTDNTDIDELSALQASLLVSSVRSSFRNSGNLVPMETSTETSALYDNQSDSTIFQLYTITDLASSDTAYQTLQQIDEQCITHLSYLIGLLGFSYFKRVFQHFRILISTVKEQGDYARIVSGGILDPVLLGPDSLQEKTNMLQNMKRAHMEAGHAITVASKSADNPSRTVSFKRLEDIPNSHTLISMIRTMIRTVALTIQHFMSCSFFPRQHHIKLLDYVRDFISGYKDYLFIDTRISRIEPMLIDFNVYGVLFKLTMTSKDDVYKKVIELIRLLLREENYRISKVNNISLVQISALFSGLVTSEEDYRTMLLVITDITKDSNSLANIAAKLQQVLHDRNSINKVAFCINPITGEQYYELDFLLSLYLDQAELYFQQPEMRFEALKALFQLLMENNRHIEAAHISILMCSLISELTHREATIIDSYDVELRYAIIPGLLITSKSSRMALLSPMPTVHSQQQKGIDSPTLSSVISQIPYRLEQLWLFRECIHDFRRILPGLTIQTEKDVIQRAFDQSISVFSLNDFFSLLNTAGELFLKCKQYWQASVVFNLLVQLYNKFDAISKVVEAADLYKQAITKYLEGEQANDSKAYLVSFHNFEKIGDVEEYIYYSNLTPDDFRLNLRSFYAIKHPEVIICGQGSRFDLEQSNVKMIKVTAVKPVLLTQGTELTEIILSKIQTSLMTYFTKITGSSLASEPIQPHGLRKVTTGPPSDTSEIRSSLGTLSPIPRFSQQRLDAAGFNIHRYIALVLSYVCESAGLPTSAPMLSTQQNDLYGRKMALYSYVFKYSYASPVSDSDKGSSPKSAGYGQIDRYCFVPYAFPSYKTRQIVIGSYSQKIPPIIASAFRVLEKGVSIGQHIQNRDPISQVHLTLSGILMALVNKGPVHLAELFLTKITPHEYVDLPTKAVDAAYNRSPTTNHTTNIGNLSIARVIMSQRALEGTPQAQTFQLHSAREVSTVNVQSRFSGAFGSSYPSLPGAAGPSCDTLTRYSVKCDEISLDSRISKTFRTSGYITYPDTSSNRDSVTSTAISDGGFTLDSGAACPDVLLSNWEDFEPTEYLSMSLKYMMEQVIIGLEYSTELCKHGMSEIALQKTLLTLYIEMINKLKYYLKDWDYSPLMRQCTSLLLSLESIS